MTRRAKPSKERLQAVIDRSKAVLEIPDNYRVGIVAASDTGAIEMALLKIARRQNAETIEGKQVSDRSQFAIFRRRFTGRAIAQLPRKQCDLRTICNRGCDLASKGDRLQEFRPHHGAQSASTGVSTVRTQVGEAHQVLAGDADRRHTTKGRKRARRLLRGAAPVLTRPEPAIDEFGGLRTRSDQNDGVDPEYRPRGYDDPPKP